jgi:hypothetical protein
MQTESYCLPFVNQIRILAAAYVTERAELYKVLSFKEVNSNE